MDAEGKLVSVDVTLPSSGRSGSSADSVQRDEILPGRGAFGVGFGQTFEQVRDQMPKPVYEWHDRSGNAGLVYYHQGVGLAVEWSGGSIYTISASGIDFVMFDRRFKMGMTLPEVLSQLSSGTYEVRSLSDESEASPLRSTACTLIDVLVTGILIGGMCGLSFHRMAGWRRILCASVGSSALAGMYGWIVSAAERNGAIDVASGLYGIRELRWHLLLLAGVFGAVISARMVRSDAGHWLDWSMAKVVLRCAVIAVVCLSGGLAASRWLPLTVSVPVALFVSLCLGAFVATVVWSCQIFVPQRPAVARTPDGGPTNGQEQRETSESH